MKKETPRGSGRVFLRSWRNPKTGRMIKSPTWWVQYSVRGIQIRQTTKTTEYKKALEFLKNQRELSAPGGMTNGERYLLKFQYLANLIRKSYKQNKRKTIVRLETSIKHLNAFFGGRRVADITEGSLSEYVDYRLDVEKAANATVKHELLNLHRMFKLSAEFRNTIPIFPIIRVSNVRQGFFEEDEFARFQECFDSDLRGLLIFANITGWRMQSEIFPLTWSHVDFSAGEIRLEPGTTKTDEGRTFPFGDFPEIESVIRQQRKQTDRLQLIKGRIIPWVFHRDGNKIDNIRPQWKKALEKSGISRKIPHDFRRTAVRRLERAGVPRSVSMKLVGHKTEEIYRRYAIVAKNDLIDGIKRLADYRAQTGKTQENFTDFPEQKPAETTASEGTPENI